MGSDLAPGQENLDMDEKPSHKTCFAVTSHSNHQKIIMGISGISGFGGPGGPVSQSCVPQNLEMGDVFPHLAIFGENQDGGEMDVGKTGGWKVSWKESNDENDLVLSVPTLS